jgi:endo-1,4-beta-xylanase
MPNLNRNNTMPGCHKYAPWLRPILLIACIILANQFVWSQAIPAGSINLADTPKLLKTNQTIKDLGTISASPADSVLTVTTLRQPDFIYNLSSRVPIKPVNVEMGRVLLLCYSAKTVSANLETGEARINWVLQVSDKISERIERTMNVSANWTTYYVPIEVNQNVDKNQLALNMQFGYPAQQFLIKDIQLWLCPKGTTLAQIPQTKIRYTGMEPDAPWRQAANERIEQYRKGDFELRFTQGGKPLAGTVVQVELKRPHFNWGTAVQAQSLLADAKLLDQLSQRFNLMVFENDLKIKHWGQADKKKETLAAIKLLQDRNILIKGHALIWPGFRYLPASFEKNKNNPKKIIALNNAHMNSVIAATKNKISRWDVVNEAYTNKDLQNITGSEEILYDGFRKLKSEDPKALRFVNEYGIISRGGIDQKKQQWYYDFVRRIDKNTGNLVDGIGMQSHIGYDLTPPERVVQILDFYAPLNKRVAISEFTMDIEDPVVREQYTRDFMIAAFSHPSVTDFLFWGYQSKKVDFFDADGQLGAMGKAFDSLVSHEWKTRLSATTTLNGSMSGRGFFGTYEYSFVQNNQVIKGTFSLLPGADPLIEINVR